MGNDIRATRDGESRFFSNSVWNQLPAHKYGFKTSTDTPEEVRTLSRPQGTAGIKDDLNPTAAKTSKAVAKGPKEAAEASADKPKTVTQLVKSFKDVKSLKELEAAFPKGEKRSTVVKAYEAKKKEFK